TIRGLGNGLDSLADWIGPGEGRKEGETASQCVARIAGASPALAISGVSGIAAGAAPLGYPRAPRARGGGGTSLISSAARGAFGGQTMGGGSFLGTGNIGGAIGRFASRTSVVVGAAILGKALGQSAGAVQVCNR